MSNETPKVCPVISGISEAGSYISCVGPRCAWWYEFPSYSRDPADQRGCCAILKIADFNR